MWASGHRAVVGRGSRAAGPSGRRAAGPWRAVGRGLLGRGPAFSKTPSQESLHSESSEHSDLAIEKALDFQQCFAVKLVFPIND